MARFDTLGWQLALIFNDKSIVREQGVGSSNLPAPTNKIKWLRSF